ncbi:XdhC family protein [Paenibacillus sp. IB182496]|uniref:XdhC family protein n=1 Tax=Paenibacillus sabuli TaxID=2772509 RepID=A0A927GPQ9_9BACL|nr:XdhC/CoxI family protein [Paenibacillus sabuli]MBD2843734.1 XdhC family protein [Paenibacillus sabuli]
MEELRDRLRACMDAGEPCVVAVIVRVEGSAYRREGARCLIRAGGEVHGILSGGCIEEELCAYAEEILRSGRSRMVHYDFRTDEDAVWGTGVGCNGAVTIWLEPFDPASRPERARAMLDDLDRRIAAAEPYEAVTVLGSSDPQRWPEGTRLRRPADESGTPGAAEEESAVRVSRGGAGEPLGMRDMAQSPGFHTEVWADGAELELLIEPVRPRPELIIVGVGDDARVLCRLARQLEWKVRIVYHATDRLSAARFPEANALTVVSRLDYRSVAVRDAYVVVMTHQLELDSAAVTQLLVPEAAYVGLVGSRYRLQRILAALTAERGEPDATLLDKLHSPVGLDIGAETAEEIALSILAEAMARRRGRAGGPLRELGALGGRAGPKNHDEFEDRGEPEGHARSGEQDGRAARGMRAKREASAGAADAQESSGEAAASSSEESYGDRRVPAISADRQSAGAGRSARGHVFKGGR